MKADDAEASPPSFDDCPESQRCAAVLSLGVVGAMVLLVVVLGIYVSAAPAPQVPIRELPRYWGLRSSEFISRTGLPTGSRWLTRLGQGDVLTILPGAGLAALSAIWLAAILPLYVRRRDFIYAVIVLGQLLLIVLAAAGV